ncbi:hypothetical protein QQS21_003891 [Conoideocrella luteorostrata]|uniref:DnaJ homologue subfamily C member 28 conserved domain-containing protein n=1 Tax=Conoideocrella luteorostrata TaxID=1105319 RepID=A0AAJ0G096_9HYPO|nr:hypothetical protein QQS21_003891 [Conoideocrella luteorostrata]
MPAVRLIPATLCGRCAHILTQPASRRYVHHTARSNNAKTAFKDKELQNSKNVSLAENSEPKKAEPGAMTHRLEEATEETLLSGGISGRRAVEDAGFSEELKDKLLNKIADTTFRNQYSGVFTQAGPSPSSTVLKQRQGVSNGNIWTGTEVTEDTVLRMLNDSKKPLNPADRGRFQPPVVDTCVRRTLAKSPGQRAASARDKANFYARMDIKMTSSLTDQEKEEMKAELRERFQSAARALPTSISGLTALANQRIEDAISRGQFKNLPRGKKMERDPRADNPFIDTTEYIMNKLIQRQEIVPPWIEKQQELTKTARVFRERLRNDWKRHAARMISSHGGSLEEQMKRAAIYAAAEMTRNPACKPSATASTLSNSPDCPVVEGSPMLEEIGSECSNSPDSSEAPPDLPTSQRPFRDLAWEQAEKSYMNLSIENLNSMTRSYNLMAPELARKPYFSLERELNSCFADVAPLVANEIKVRAVGRKVVSRSGEGVTGVSSLMEKLIGKDNVKIHLEASEKAYGLREWWRDFWKGK